MSNRNFISRCGYSWPASDGDSGRCALLPGHEAEFHNAFHVAWVEGTMVVWRILSGTGNCPCLQEECDHYEYYIAPQIGAGGIRGAQK